MSVSGAIRIFGPRIPLLLKTALLHTVNQTETSSKWDLQTELTIIFLRSLLTGGTSSVSKQQAFFLKPIPVKGPMWIADVKVPAPPENDIRQLLFRTIDSLNQTGDETYTKPDLLPVEGEWTGYRACAKGAAQPDLLDSEIYANLQNETTSNLTILYFHGGAYYLMDPSSHRAPVAQLCKLTGGRAFSVRYRLAPQNPFPAALLDCLVAYLSLIYPPEGSLHSAVDPRNIVFAGDSAGANMCVVLMLTLLTMRANSANNIPTVHWNGHDVEIPLPAGAATNAAWCDVTRSMPSLQENAKFDYLPPPPPVDSPLPHPPACQAWPADPRRADLYCDGPSMCHPLISPLAAKAELWKDCPPLYFCAGQEMLEDEIRAMVSRLAKEGVKVRWEGFEAGAHCFAMIFPTSLLGRRCMGGWANFSKSVILDGEGVKEGGVWVDVKGKEEERDVKALGRFSDEEIWQRMNTERERRIRMFEEEQLAGKETAKL